MIDKLTRGHGAVWIVAPLLVVVTLLVVWLSMPFRLTQTNADQVYPMTLATDLLTGTYSLLTWKPSPPPFVLPDLTLYPMLRAFGMNDTLASSIYALCASGFTLAGMTYFLKRTRPRLIPLGLGIWAAIHFAVATADWIALSFMHLTPVFHHALIPLTLLMAGIASATTEGELQGKTYWSFIIVATLVAFTDLLSLFPAFCGVVGALVLSRSFGTGRLKIRWVHDISLVLVPVVAAMVIRMIIEWTTGIVFPAGIVLSDWPDKVTSLAYWANTVSAIGSMILRAGMVSILAIGGFLCSAGALYVEAKRASAGRADSRRLFALSFLVCSPLASFLLPVLLTMLKDVHGVRYLSAWTAMTPLGIAFALEEFNRKFDLGMPDLRTQAVAIGIPLIVLGAFVSYDLRAELNKQWMDHTEQPYAEDIACLDEVARGEHELAYGAATYWDAKPIQALSREGLLVNQFRPDLSRHHWINNRDWYATPENRPVPYDFILVPGGAKTIESLDGEIAMKELVRERFGTPASNVDCGDFKVFVYDRQKDLAFRRFDHVRTRVDLGLEHPAHLHAKPDAGVRDYVEDLTPIADSRSMVLDEARGFAVDIKDEPVDFINISAPAGATWSIEFLQGAAERRVGQLTLRPSQWEDRMRTRIRSIPESARGAFDRVVIDTEGGPSALGHIFVGRDTVRAD